MKTNKPKLETSIGCALVCFGAVVLLLAGCSKTIDPTTGSNSNWLKSCSTTSDCGEDLGCFCGTCSSKCTQKSDCRSYGASAVCQRAAETSVAAGCLKAETLEPPAICLLPCRQEVDCEGVSKATLGCLAYSCVDETNISIWTETEANDAGKPFDGGPWRDAAVFDAEGGDASNDVTIPVDGTAPAQPGSQPDALSQLYGNRYTFLADRKWNGRSTLSDLPWDDGWIELPEEDFEAISGTSYTVTFSDDGLEITVEGTSPEWMGFETGRRLNVKDEQVVYEVSAARFTGGRLRIWKNGNGFAAELMVYGSGIPIVLCERGTLVYKALDLTQLNGKRYSLFAKRQWDSSTFERNPSLDGCKELSDDDTGAVRIDTHYAITFSDDGSGVTIDHADSSEWTAALSGTRLVQSNTEECIYEVFNPAVMVGMIGNYRLRVWTDGKEFGAEFLLYGVTGQVNFCQRGTLIDSCASDDDCAFGSVCEPTEGCSTGRKACVRGCRDNTDCVTEEICATEFDCSTCPCPGRCENPYAACFSPVQNSERAYETGVVGCACDLEGQSICVGQTRLIALECRDGRWTSVEDGPCEPREQCGQETLVSTASTCLDNYQLCWIVNDLTYWGRENMFCGEKPRNVIPECPVNHTRSEVCTSCGPIAPCLFPERHCLKNCRDDTDCLDEPVFSKMSYTPSKCANGMCTYGVTGCI